MQKSIKVNYHAIELNPINKEYYIQLNFTDLIGLEKKDLSILHNSPWEKKQKINPYFSLTKNNTSLEKYNWQSRSSQLHNEEIRKFYGYKKFNISNWRSIAIYLQDNCFSRGDSTIQVQKTIYDYLRDRKIEPPAKSIIIRKIRSLFTKFETQFFDYCADFLTIRGKRGIKRIISPNREPIILSVLRKNTGKLG